MIVRLLRCSPFTKVALGASVFEPTGIEDIVVGDSLNVVFEGIDAQSFDLFCGHTGINVA
jgi:hypothetical protein